MFSYELLTAGVYDRLEREPQTDRQTWADDYFILMVLGLMHLSLPWSNHKYIHILKQSVFNTLP